MNFNENFFIKKFVNSIKFVFKLHWCKLCPSYEINYLKRFDTIIKWKIESETAALLMAENSLTRILGKGMCQIVSWSRISEAKKYIERKDEVKLCGNLFSTAILKKGFCLQSRSFFYEIDVTFLPGKCQWS